MGKLLAYFLGPGTAGGLQFQDIISQVLKENLKHIEKRRLNAASALRNCTKRRAQVRTEFDATSEAMQIVGNPSRLDMEHQLSSLQTSLSVVKRSIAKYENIIEDCRIQEEEACHEEEASHEREEEESPNAEMVKEEERSDAGPSDLQGEVNAEGIPPLESTGNTVSPEEDALLMQPAPQPKDLTVGSHSPRSKAGTVSGEMAELSLTSPSQPGPEEDETPQ